MSRKSAISELQSDEVSNSPLRRSTRIVNGNGAAAAVSTRRTSYTTESEIPAKATRSRRSSAQSVEDKTEIKTSTRSKRASALIEQESQKETTPVRRGRRSSVTAEPSKTETEKPKPVRTRRSSRANSEDNEEKPQISVPVRGRRNSVTVDSEPEEKVAVKTPARTTTRRRSSATENVVAPEVSTPVKRTTRGRRASDTEVLVEEAKKPTTRGRRKSINQEEDTKIEEVAKPTLRRAHNSSTDIIEVNPVAKTPEKSTRRTSFDLETEDINNIAPTKEKMDDVAEKEISPVTLKDMTIKVTPLKKRKLLDKIEAELDLSIINESSDDISNINEEELLKDESQSPSDKNILGNSATSRSTSNSPSNQLNSSKKRTNSAVESETSPRKSPRLIEKMSTENISRKKSSPEMKDVSPKMFTTHNSEGINADVKPLFNNPISSGSDGSFRFHMSRISLTESVPNSTQEDNVLDTSKESTGSNKENVGLSDAIKSKNNIEKSPEIVIQKSISVSRISNVFKPNQKEYSFMEPMEVDMSFDNFNMDKSVALDESSVIFNRNSPKHDSTRHQESLTKTIQDVTVDSNADISSKKDADIQESKIKCQMKIVDDLKSNFTETEGSDNIIIEETDKTVDIGIKPNTRRSKSDVSTNTVVSSVNNRDVANDLVEKVKVAFAGTSSSPLKVKRRSLRKTRSPPADNSTDSESDSRENLRVFRPNRWTKSKSKTPSPMKDSKDNMSSKSQNKSTQKDAKKSGNDNAFQSDSETQKYKDSSILSGNIAPRSKSVSPVQSEQTTQTTENNDIIFKKSIGENGMTSLDQSFEKSKGSEEIFISNEKICINVLNDTQVSQKEKEPTILTNTELSGLRSEENLELTSSLYKEKSGQTKTDHLTILATTNNDDTNMEIKHSDSTHYDFDLPSDDDELLNSESNSINIAVNSNNVTTDTDKNTSNCEEESRKFTNDSSETAESDLDDVFEENEDRDISRSEKSKYRNILDDDLKKIVSKASKIGESRSENSKENVSAEIAKATVNEKLEKNNEDSVVTNNWQEPSTGSSVVSEQGPKRISLSTDSTRIKTDSIIEPQKGTSSMDKVTVNVKETIEDKIETCNDELKETTNDSPKLSTKSSTHLTTKSKTNDMPVNEESVMDVKSSSMSIDDESSNVSNNSQERCVESCTSSDIISKCETNKTSPKNLTQSDNAKVFTEDNVINDSLETATKLSDKDRLGKDLSGIKTNSTINSYMPETNKVGDNNEVLNLKPRLVPSPTFSSASTADIKLHNDSEEGDRTSFQETSLERSEQIKEIASRKSNEEDAKNKKTRELNMKPSKSVKSEDRKPIKARSSLDEFATVKLSEYLKARAKEIEESDSEEDVNEDSASEKDYNEFIDGMAEEGEEDTPSEDSNQIIDEGESVGFSDSEYASSEEYDQNDSFICDDEEPELLSGEEYDLSNPKESTKKKSRIIDTSTLGDEDIIKIPKKKADKDVPKKKSRIIMISDSSSEEETNAEDMKVKIEVLEKDDRNSDESIILVEEPKDSEDKGKILKESRTSTVENKFIKSNEDPEEITAEEKSMKIADNENNKEPILENLSAINTSLQNRHRRSSLSIQENIVIDGLKDPMISKRINNLVESFCSTVKKGEIALNLSLEYEDSNSTHSTKETESIHILSNVTICPGTSSDTERELQVQNMSQESETGGELKISINQGEDLREVLNKKNLKRRLSKSLTEVYEEEKKAKKRKKNKNKLKKSASEEKLTKPGKKDKLRPDSSEVLKAGTFSLTSQLITDVKNRPKRIIRPTATQTESDSSWIITKVKHPKPSTSPVSRHERMKVIPKLHPKDFKNRLLTDPKRVKRVETETLLKKKGAFF